jgi:hypothetical protein
MYLSTFTIKVWRSFGGFNAKSAINGPSFFSP